MPTLLMPQQQASVVTWDRNIIRTMGTRVFISPISGGGIGPFSLVPLPSRSVTQSLEEIDPVGSAGLVEMDGNGNLISYARKQFQKLKSTISCVDLRAPAMAGAWRGQAVLVNCCVERWYVAGAQPDRPLVPGTTPRFAGGFYFFRPQLTMTVLRATVSKAERAHEINWSMDLIEGAALPTSIYTDEGGNFYTTEQG